MKKILLNVNVRRASEAKQTTRAVKYLALLICFFTLKGVTVVGQFWSPYGADIYNSNTGNVGIGTAAPGGRLDVQSASTAVALRVGSGRFSMNGTAKFEIDAPGIVGGRFSILSNGNVGMGTVTPGSRLEVNSGVLGSSGLQFTQLNSSSATAAANGKLLSVDATGKVILVPTGSWNLTGNAGTNPSLNFIGTTDDVDLVFQRNNGRAGFIGTSNTSFGNGALNPNTTGSYNTANGINTLKLNTTGSSNTANGASALYSNTTGFNNTANGDAVLYNNTTGSGNTANGFYALFSNTTGSNNTANGVQALYINTTGNYNTAHGVNALNNSNGSYNTANGYQALLNNTTGYNNTSSGVLALYSNTGGWENTANGDYALYSNTTGAGNTADGDGALYGNTTGNNNTALGRDANVSTGNLTNATAIGNSATVNASNKIRLGNAGVTVIEGQVAYTVVSDGRFKNNISESDVKGLEFINRLRPVVYNFDTRRFNDFLTQHMPDSIRARHSSEEKNFRRSTAVRQSGFIAQEVEKAAKEAGYDFNGVHAPESKDDNYSLAYSQFTVPLVKAVQELSKQIEELKKENEELRELVKNAIGGKVDGSIQINGSTTEARLFQNAPNPFTQSTTIRYSLPAAAKKAVLSITSVNGARLKEYNLINNNSKGVEIAGGQFAAGTYVYSLIVDNVLVDSKKMILTH